jgi:hypothetical protein
MFMVDRCHVPSCTSIKINTIKLNSQMLFIFLHKPNPNPVTVHYRPTCIRLLGTSFTMQIFASNLVPRSLTGSNILKSQRSPASGHIVLRGNTSGDEWKEGDLRTHACQLALLNFAPLLKSWIAYMERQSHDGSTLIQFN